MPLYLFYWQFLRLMNQKCYKSVVKVCKIQEEIHNTNYRNILTHKGALKTFVHFSMFTKNWGRNWGIFDPNDFHKLFL